MSAQAILLARYGAPDHVYISKYCSTWQIRHDFPWFPALWFLVNNDFKVMLQKAFTALQTAGVHTEIHTYDGCYNDRDVRGASTTSLHAWAFAIDLNALDNPMTVSSDHAIRYGKWSPLFIQCMKGAGIFFGGDFHLRADPMHWAGLDG